MKCFSVIAALIFVSFNFANAGEAVMKNGPTTDPFYVFFDDVPLAQMSKVSNCSYYDNPTMTAWFKYLGKDTMKLRIRAPNVDGEYDFVMTNSNFPRHDNWIPHAHELIFAKKTKDCDPASEKVEQAEFVYASTDTPEFLILVKINFETKSIRIKPNINSHSFSLIGHIK